MSNKASAESAIGYSESVADSETFSKYVRNLRIERTKGKLIAAWDPPNWKFLTGVTYEGWWTHEIAGENVLNAYKIPNITETSYEWNDFCPTHEYKVTIWMVDRGGEKGPESESEPVMLCKKIVENLYLDDTTELREGYNVYKGYMIDANDQKHEVAIKILHGVLRKVLRNKREVEALAKLDDRNIVRYLNSGPFKDGASIGKSSYIVMELCRPETFYELASCKSMSMLFLECCVLHMMLGIYAVHKTGFFHRDVKPQNLLVSQDGLTMKVADFGLAKPKNPEKSCVSNSIKASDTYVWGSPEYYNGDDLSEKSDTYSAGLVMAFGLSRGKYRQVVETSGGKTRIVDGNERDLSHLECENAEIARDLILWMLQRDPSLRPTALEVLKHPFFWNDLKKLDFLHQMKDFFTPFSLKKIPEESTKQLMKAIVSQNFVIKTSSGEVNWVKKMEETDGIEADYPNTLNAAKGKVRKNRKRIKLAKYDETSIFDLIRFIRNIEQHYQENKDLKEEFKGSKTNVWKLFYKCFPYLLSTVYHEIRKMWGAVEKGRDFPKDASIFFTKIAENTDLPSMEKQPQ